MLFEVILGTGVTGGITKWGYIFEKVGLQKRVLRVRDTRGGDTTFSKIGVFLVSIPPPKCHPFLEVYLIK